MTFVSTHSTNRLIKLIVALVVLATVLTAFGPYLVLALARQETPENDFKYADSFLTTYDEVRENLERIIESLRANGITVEYSEYAVDESDNLYIDNIYLPSTGDKTNLIVLTTGVHGIEGYIGSVMLDVFFGEIYPTLDTSNTGITLHTIGIFNPVSGLSTHWEICLCHKLTIRNA
jgi:hypothetical protein